MGLTYMFITHDLSVVNHFSDDIAVMYLGRLIEKAPSEELFAHPIHPYTQALLSAIPIPLLHNRRERIILKGEITSPIEPPAACRFANRCPRATERCHGRASRRLRKSARDILCPVSLRIDYHDTRKAEAEIDAASAFLLHKPGKRHHACMKCHLPGVKTWSTIVRKVRVR